MKIYFIIIFIFTLIKNTSIQAQSSFGIIQYNVPKNFGIDETDPSQKVFYKHYENNIYLGIYVWRTITRSGSAIDDYAYWINELKTMYPKIGNNFTREPTIETRYNPLSRWQSSYIKTTHENLHTGKEETVYINLWIFTKGKKTAAVHFITNDQDRTKGDMQIFFKSIKLKK